MENAPVLNPTPKQRFMAEEGNVKKHREMIDDRPFQRATDFAMLEYQRVLLNTATLLNADAMACGYRLQGAQEFLQTLKLLAETPRSVAPVPAPKLDHTV